MTLYPKCSKDVSLTSMVSSHEMVKVLVWSLGPVAGPLCRAGKELPALAQQYKWWASAT